MSRRLGWVAAVAAVLLAGTLFLLGRWEHAVAARDTAAMHGARQVLATSKAWRQRQAELRERERAARAAARADHRRWLALKDSLARADPALRAAVAAGAVVPPAAARVIEMQDAVMQACGRELASLWLSDSTCAVRADRAEARVARLEAATASVLAVKECRFLVFRCPSRTTVAVVSGTAGLVGGVYIGVRLAR